MRRDSHPDAVRAQRLELAQVVGDRLLPESRAAAAEVAGRKQDERHTGLVGGCGSRPGLLEPEVVELAHGRVAVRAQFPVDLDVLAPDLVDRERLGEGDHAVAPGPEVAARRPPAERSLKRMAVRVHEAGDRQGAHRRILSP